MRVRNRHPKRGQKVQTSMVPKDRMGKNTISNPKRQGIKFHYLLPALMMATLGVRIETGQKVNAAECKDLKVVFSGTTGDHMYQSEDYKAFKNALEPKLATTGLTYDFEEVYYPSVGDMNSNMKNLVSRHSIDTKKLYELATNIGIGAAYFRNEVTSTNTRCPNTKYVLAGYSQGAVVLSEAVKMIDPEFGWREIVYAATLGDPKLYLPEGRGLIPSACFGRSLSDYRMYVPDCRAYKGILAGSSDRYQLNEILPGRVGTWCNKKDVFCSSGFSIRDHESYIEDGIYEDVSKVLFDKITQAFGIERPILSSHDTAILIDSTGSMGSMIDKYKEEAYRLAKKTLESGGRVALYDYRDLGDPYEAKQHCNFETCTLETFAESLDNITTDGGGDMRESLLSSSFKVMKDLEWKYGSTKSLVVITDAGFLSPDRDGITLSDVVALSKEIDPVNFYVVTDKENSRDYEELTRRTDGKVVTSVYELHELTDYIMDRYDSLPRVEEDNSEQTLPVINVEEVKKIDSETVSIRFTNTGAKAILALNDVILGVTDETEITLSGLDNENIGGNWLSLTPVMDDIKGTSVTIDLGGREKDDVDADSDSDTDSVDTDSDNPDGLDDLDDGSDSNHDTDNTDDGSNTNDDSNKKKDESDDVTPMMTVIPKAPNTGRAA